MASGELKGGDVETQVVTDGSSSTWLLCTVPELLSYYYAMVTELWRRLRLEVIVEWPMLKQRWKIIVFGIIMQYVHGMFTQLAHRMHQPLDKPLHDVGFELTPELGPDKHWVSEAIFGTLFALFVLWTFTPFVFQRKRFYTAVMWSRLLMVLVVCQALRIVTFSATQLPGPSFHCRADSPTARRAWPTHWSGHFIVDVNRQVSKGCGDLIFSSHTIFMLTGVLTYNEYGSWAIMKGIAWAAGAVLSFLIVASRKHYTVDVVIAWYTVPLVFYWLHRRYTTRRPMSEFLEAVTSDFDDDSADPQDLQEVVVLDGRAGGVDGKSLISVAAPRNSHLTNGSGTYHAISHVEMGLVSQHSGGISKTVTAGIGGLSNSNGVSNGIGGGGAAGAGSIAIARPRSMSVLAAEAEKAAVDRGVHDDRGGGAANGGSNGVTQRSWWNGS